MPRVDELIEAAADNDLATVRALVPSELAPDTQDANMMSAAAVASIYGHRGIVEYLLDQGADPNLECGAGTTLAIAAGWANSLAVVRLLLQHEADPNLTDKKGTTPLLASIYSPESSPAIFEALLDAGADPTYRSPEGNTVVEMAIGRQRTILATRGYL